MLPLSLRSVLVCALLLLARTANATWTESGDVDIAISTPGTVLVEAEDVEESDVMAYVYVGGSSTTGEVTVVGEGDVTTRKQLGDWDIRQGTGDIQTVIGTFSARVTIGNSAAPTSTAGVLNILNSDLDDVSSFAVYQGTLNVTGSRIGYVEVYEDAALYALLGSRLAGLVTQEDSYTSLEESLLLSNFTCQLWSTVIIEDSVVRCRRINVDNPGGAPSSVDLRAFAAPFFELETTEELEVNGGTVNIEGAVATTGELLVGSDDSYVGIAASVWTNAGNTIVQYSGPASPNQLAIGAGSRFHELGLVRVAGAGDNLTVNGAGTELEVEGDLRIGEALNHLSQPIDIEGGVRVSNDATVIVHGTLAVRPQGTLTIESGATVYAATVENLGTITENGGTLVVPEAGAPLGGVVSLVVLARRARRVAASRARH
jgi:hypothetical protein